LCAPQGSAKERPDAQIEDEDEEEPAGVKETIWVVLRKQLYFRGKLEHFLAA
jgi:hypothetical protein